MVVAPFYPQTNESYVDNCVIDLQILSLFKRMVNVTSLTHNPCQVVGRELLRLCEPPDEVDNYAFAKVLGIGLNGFVFQCLYKNVKLCAVKMIIV